MAALTNRRKKAFCEGALMLVSDWKLVVSPPTAWFEVVQLPLKGAIAVGAAPVGVVVSRPE